MHSAVSLQSEAKLKNDDGTVWEVVVGKSNPELYCSYVISSSIVTSIAVAFETADQLIVRSVFFWWTSPESILDIPGKLGRQTFPEPIIEP